jgi:hypothetical protein
MQLIDDPKRIRSAMGTLRKCLSDPDWKCPDEVIPQVFQAIELCIQDGRPNRIDAMVRLMVKLMNHNLEAIKRQLRVQFPIRDFHAAAALDEVEKQLESPKAGIRNEGVKNIVRMLKHNLERTKTEIALELRAEEEASQVIDGSATTIVVVEDEGWYGNDAHAKAAQAPALPDPDPA